MPEVSVGKRTAWHALYCIAGVDPTRLWTDLEKAAEAIQFLWA